MSPREKVLFMKPVLAPLLPADMASAKVYPERLYGNAKCLCPEGRLCTDSVSRIVSCTGGIHSVSILFAVSVWILVWIGYYDRREWQYQWWGADICELV